MKIEGKDSSLPIPARGAARAVGAAIRVGPSPLAALASVYATGGHGAGWLGRQDGCAHHPRTRSLAHGPGRWGLRVAGQHDARDRPEAQARVHCRRSFTRPGRAASLGGQEQN